MLFRMKNAHTSRIIIIYDSLIVCRKLELPAANEAGQFNAVFQLGLVDQFFFFCWN